MKLSEMKNISLFFVILLLIVLIFVSRKEGLVTSIDEEITVPIKNDKVVRIQLNNQLRPGQAQPFGDAWINLGDITLRDKDGNQINYGNTNNVYFGNKGNWGGLPVQQLWDNDKVSLGHASREYENLIINLNPVELGSVQITNRQDCCEKRIGNYEMALYNDNNERIGYTKLENLVGLGKTVRYNMSYPK